ncbi:MAG: glutathione S-transferase family protein [Deltaproteobacteria bacterium]|nr:glutathione S-transferase family protein [Deltaproteobacteria bacterium]
MPVLYIGNKNYSSWSLRPWLALTWAGIAFEERVIPLGGPGYGRGRIAEIRAVSPTGRVPALDLGELVIWDSLSICEWAAETAPSAGLWPTDAAARAICRSVVCEMHSGFGAMRRDLSMNLRRRTTPKEWPNDTADDLARVDELWRATRARFGGGGPFLVGARTIADAFYAPVVTRLRTYGVPLSPEAAAYSAAVLADPAFRAWEAAAEAETWTMPGIDAL